MRNTMRMGTSLLAIAAIWIGGTSDAAAEDTLGSVSSLAGSASAQRPGEEPRPLDCGDPVYADDTVWTAADSRVGVMLDDVMAHLAPQTRVALGRTDAATPAATLEAGRVRMIDPRDAGAPARLAALDARAEVLGNDAEAYLFKEKVGPYAMLCEWDAPLPVARADENLSADPGECVISKSREPLYLARAHDERIPAAAAELCDLGPEIASLAGAPHKHLSPADVSAPGPAPGIGSAGLGAVSPAGATQPNRSACDGAGSACSLPIPVGAFVPPPITGQPGPGAP